MMFKRVLFTIL